MIKRASLDNEREDSNTIYDCKHSEVSENILHVRCFGWPQVSFNGEPIKQFSSAKALALLVYLAHFPHKHARQKMTGLLWSEFSEKKGQTSLRSTLYSLAQSLPDILDVNRKTIRLSERVTLRLDTQEFICLAKHKERKNREKALKLFQHEFLSGFEVREASLFQEWQDEKREDFNRIASSCFSSLLEEYEQMHQTTNILQWGSHFLRMEPWNERTYRQLMLSFAREGSFHRSIKLFQQCKEMLQKDLGIEPAPATESLHKEILQARLFPEPKLPQNNDFFLGRKNEQKQLELLLFSPNVRVVNLVGMGGIGKTALAKRLAAPLSNRFLHNAHWIDLRLLNSATELPFVIAQTMQVKLEGKQSVSEQVLNILEEKEALLILDNLEHLLDQKKDFPWLHLLLSRTLRIKLLITSRIALHFKEARNLALQGLLFSSENEYQEPEERLLQNAQRLFVETVQRFQPDYQPLPDEALITQVCNELQGLPLGIEIAAGSLFGESGKKQIASLEKLIQTFHSPWNNAPKYHQNLRIVFQHSWKLLSAKEQKGLFGLSLFADGAQLQACEEILGIDEMLLQSLIEHSLLQLNDSRYQLHETIRCFATDERIDEQEKWLNCHANYYLSSLFEQSLSLESESEVEPASIMMVREWANIQKAWDWCVAKGMWELIYQSSSQIHEFLAANGRYHEGYHWLTKIVEEWPQNETPTVEEKRAKGSVFIYLSGFALRTEEIGQNKEKIEEGIRLIEPLDEPTLLAFANNVLGTTLLYQGARKDASTFLMRAIELYRKASEQKTLLRPLINLGSLYIQEGELEQANQCFFEALTLGEKLDELYAVAHSLNNLGAVATIQCKYEVAQEFLERCTAVCQKIEYHYVEATC